MTLLVTGDKYQTADKWQQLKCRTSDRAVNDQLRQLRAIRKQVVINPKAMFVDRLVLAGRLPPGETEVSLDNLAVRPLVRFQTGDAEVNADPVQPVNESIPIRGFHRSRLKNDRLFR